MVENVAVIQEAWIGGVSTCRVDKRVAGFLGRALEGDWPYL
jgi:hypothetical protein